MLHSASKGVYVQIKGGYHPSVRSVPTVRMSGTAVDLHYRTLAPRKSNISSDLLFSTGLETHPRLRLAIQ